jgi:hypothetical protein
VPGRSGDEVSLADLGVVEVQVEPEVGVVHGVDQGERVGGAGERGAGVVDGGVEVLQGEDAAGAFAEPGEAVEGAGCGEPRAR